MKESAISAELFEECRNLLKDKDTYLESWDEFSTCKIKGADLVIHRQPAEDSSLYEYFSYGTLDASAEDMYRVNVDFEYRLKWDDYATTIELFGEDNAPDPTQGEQYLYWVVKYPWPMSSREYVFCRRGEVDEEGGLWMLAALGTDKEGAPSNKKYVKVSGYKAFMVFERVDDDHCKFAMRYFDNPGGNIPSSLINWVSRTAIPKFMGALLDAVKKMPPKSDL